MRRMLGRPQRRVLYLKGTFTSDLLPDLTAACHEETLQRAERSGCCGNCTRLGEYCARVQLIKTGQVHDALRAEYCWHGDRTAQPALASLCQMVRSGGRVKGNFPWPPCGASCDGRTMYLADIAWSFTRMVRPPQPYYLTYKIVPPFYVLPPVHVHCILCHYHINSDMAGQLWDFCSTTFCASVSQAKPIGVIWACTAHSSPSTQCGIRGGGSPGPPF